MRERVKTGVSDHDNIVDGGIDSKVKIVDFAEKLHEYDVQNAPGLMDLVRALHVIKMRGVNHSRNKHVLRITNEGVNLVPLFNAGID